MNWKDRLKEIIAEKERERAKKARQHSPRKLIALGDLSGRMPGGINHVPETEKES